MYFCDMKVLYILFGTLSLALGIIGIFLPLLPTTPFLLLTAALYVRSSPRLYNRLLHHKYLGSYIRNFRENKAIPLRAKIISVSLIWITILNCIFFIVPYWWLKAVLLLIAAGTSYQNTEIDSKNAPSPLRASASLSSQCFTEFCPIMSVTYFTAMNGVFLVRHTHAWA